LAKLRLDWNDPLRNVRVVFELDNSATANRNFEKAREHVITRKMKRWLRKVDNNPSLRKTLKNYVYMKRLQKRLERELILFEWLVHNHPELYLDGKCRSRLVKIHEIEGKLLGNPDLKERLKGVFQ